MQLNIPLILSLISAVPVIADRAPKIKKNPKNVIAVADFPFGCDKNVKGNIVFTAKKGGVVNVHVDMTGLPSSGGPFQYHIHEKLVPGDGDCDYVGDHFDPYDGAEDCEAERDDSLCQVGDLSGKHGWIDTTCFETYYNDPYLSLNKKSKSYIVGKSITFHFANQTKFACADIELASNLRLQSLKDEYESNSNSDLKELQSDLAAGYEFNQDYKEYTYDEDEASQYEVFEKDHDEQEPLPRQKNVANRNDTSSVNSSTSDVNGYYNNSNISGSEYGPDCENGSPKLGLSVGLTAGLGAIAGLLF